MLDNLKVLNQKRWNAMTVNPDAIKSLDKVATKLIASKDRYVAVSNKTNVPWFVIALIHLREADQSWMANLAQGDRWDRVSTHIPRGQGPFSSWEEAAINALKYDHLTTWGDWSIGGTLTALEKYNGLGYSSHGKSSPYVWASTDMYTSGKYISDGVYDPSYVDKQSGCAAILSRMMLLDKTITFTGISKPVVNTSTKVATTTAAVGTAAIAAAPHLWPYILIGTVLAAGLVYLLFRKV